MFSRCRVGLISGISSWSGGAPSMGCQQNDCHEVAGNNGLKSRRLSRMWRMTPHRRTTRRGAIPALVAGILHLHRRLARGEIERDVVGPSDAVDGMVRTDALEILMTEHHEHVGLFPVLGFHEGPQVLRALE